MTDGGERWVEGTVFEPNSPRLVSVRGVPVEAPLGGTMLIVLQSLIHMGVCVGLLPTKGLPFPLLSYGGSSLIASFAMIGLILNVSQHSN